jgi:hypothetical protein
MKCTPALTISVALFTGVITLWAASVAKGADEAPDYELRPILTHYAKTATKVTFTAEFKAFRDLELQEAENFDGIGTDVELVIPFAKRFQLRLYAPIYTAGSARLVNPPHKNIDIWGWGGTLDFSNVQLDWQFLTESDHGFNMAVGGGVGYALRYLNTSIKDKYNHVGRVLLGGLKFDRKINDLVTVVANAGVRYYWESDDLNPSEGGDSFGHADLSVAGVFNPFHHTVYPVLELAYAGDFSGYNSVTVMPEIIWPINTHFELKAGATLGLTSDGERVGARVQAVARF